MDSSGAGKDQLVEGNEIFDSIKDGGLPEYMTLIRGPSLANFY